MALLLRLRIFNLKVIFSGSLTRWIPKIKSRNLFISGDHKLRWCDVMQERHSRKRNSRRGSWGSHVMLKNLNISQHNHFCYPAEVLKRIPHKCDHQFESSPKANVYTEQVSELMLTTKQFFTFKTSQGERQINERISDVINNAKSFQFLSKTENFMIVAREPPEKTFIYFKSVNQFRHK